MPRQEMTMDSNRLERVRLAVQEAFQSLVRRWVTHRTTRIGLNTLYRALSYAQMHFFFENFCVVFSDPHKPVDPGHWTVDFVSRSVRLPLRPEQMCNDWFAATSILGDDIEIKQTYAALIGSAQPPELFIDVGTNNGLHSLLFLIHRIETLSFEPNSSCHGYFLKSCEMNKVSCHLEKFALGDRAGTIELCYPENYTWLGSTKPSVKQEFEHYKERERYAGIPLVQEKVQQKTLDDALPELGARRILIKIDTEGNEESVLRGAIRTLEKYRPLVIFESRTPEERRKLFDWLQAHGYGVARLPWNPDKPSPFLELPQLISSADYNFIAAPHPK